MMYARRGYRPRATTYRARSTRGGRSGYGRYGGRPMARSRYARRSPYARTYRSAYSRRLNVGGRRW